MAVNMYREYRLKFYLNMRHYIIINEVKGETHPHTWEFALDIKFSRNLFVEFNIFAFADGDTTFNLILTFSGKRPTLSKTRYSSLAKRLPRTYPSSREATILTGVLYSLLPRTGMSLKAPHGCLNR